MPDQDQVKKIKCPYCGWVRSIPVSVLEDEIMASVVLGPSQALKAAVEKIKAALADTQLDEANAWIDMPPCPHCQNVYRYNVRTGEVRQ
jgi:uncharacterized Zn-finger protein